MVVDNLSEEIAEVALETLVLIVITIKGVIAATHTTHNRVNNTIESRIGFVAVRIPHYLILILGSIDNFAGYTIHLHPTFICRRIPSAEPSFVEISDDSVELRPYWIISSGNFDADRWSEAADAQSGFREPVRESMR